LATLIWKCGGMQISAANLLVASQQPRASAAPKPAGFTPASFDAETPPSPAPPSSPAGPPAPAYAAVAKPGSQLDIRV
jgi:hypothetical protein